jgi:hypothetical protein
MCQGCEGLVEEIKSGVRLIRTKAALNFDGKREVGK